MREVHNPGINDAADVTHAALEAVPGFGSLLVSQVLRWRLSLEMKFKFNPGRGLDPADLMRVDREVARRRGELELLLSNAPFELSAMRGRIIAARTRLQDQLDQALRDVAQAQADEIGAT